MSRRGKLVSKLYDIEGLVTAVDLILEGYSNKPKYFKEYTNEEIYRLYKDSSCSIQDIMETFYIEERWAYRFIEGKELKNRIKRNELVRFFQSKICLFA